MTIDKKLSLKVFEHLYKAQIKYPLDSQYADSENWIVGELHTKLINGELAYYLHFFVTVTSQYIPFDQLQMHIDNKNEIFEKTIAVDHTTLCRCTGKKDISNVWIFENDIIESHDGAVVLYPDMVIKYGTYQAYCPHDNCYVSSVGFYATGEDLPDMPIGDVEDYALVNGHTNAFGKKYNTFE